MSTTYKLIIYIDNNLTAPGNLADLTFARKVNGVANVIWQSKKSTGFLAINDFKWEQAYELGVTENTSDGALVDQSMQPVPIRAGQISDWTNAPNPNVIPPPKPAPPGFSPGGFGTVNLDSKYKVCINSATGGGPFKLIYVDTHPVPGMTNREYRVENNYQVSWEAGGAVEGVVTHFWNAPWSFPIPKGQTTTWISWGPKLPGGTDAEWYFYAKDPLKHDPFKAISVPPPDTN